MPLCAFITVIGPSPADRHNSDAFREGSKASLQIGQAPSGSLAAVESSREEGASPASKNMKIDHKLMPPARVRVLSHIRAILVCALHSIVLRMHAPCGVCYSLPGREWEMEMAG